MAQLEERNKVSARRTSRLASHKSSGKRAQPHQPAKSKLSNMDARGGAPGDSGALSDLEVAHVRSAPLAHRAFIVPSYSLAILSVLDCVTRNTLTPCRSARCC